LIRRASSWLGLKMCLQIYRLLMFLPDLIRFQSGRIRYFYPDDLL